MLVDLAVAAFSDQTPARIGVAVSGGSDSTAALLVCHETAERLGATLFAVTVDHGLRKEAADEAKFVAEICNRLGVSHRILRWQHSDIRGNLQDQARRARYDLISAWALENDIADVVLGHTANDRAETFLMRLSRAAGVEGLAAMRDCFVRDAVRFHRPFLDATRTDLREFLNDHGQVWIDDPSNEDQRFDRVKARAMLDTMRPLGVDVATLGAVADNIARARDALDHYTLRAARDLVVQDHGDLTLTRTPSDPVPAEIERRLLVAALRWISGADYAPRQSALMQMEAALSDADTFTVGGCLLTLDRAPGGADHKLRITREWRAVRDEVVATGEIWDDRWRLTGPHQPDLQIRALGAEGLVVCPGWRETGIPRASLLASPSVWQKDRLISAPMAGFLNDWSAKLEESRDDFAFALIRR